MYDILNTAQSDKRESQEIRKSVTRKQGAGTGISSTSQRVDP
jgi:hypothetical protein